MPIRGGLDETCPWCRHTFPPGSTVSPSAGAGSPRKKEPNRTVSPSAGTGPVGLTGGKKKKVMQQGDENAAAPHEGRLQPTAASVLMQILYVARMARYGLLRPTCRRACYVTKWTEACDRQLLQLIRYIHSSYALRQIGWVGDPITGVVLHVYADADLAGDVATQRSTTGVRLTLQGRSKHFPRSGPSKTPELRFELHARGGSCVWTLRS